MVWRNLLELTFHDELPREQWPDGGERWFNVVRTILDKPNSHWWDNLATPTIVERRDDILRGGHGAGPRRADHDPVAQHLRLGVGQLHRLTLVNPTLGDSGLGFVDRMFNRGPVEVGGGGGLVNATAWDAAEGYEVTAVPSMRMVVDLADLDRSRWIQLSGSSGHAYHEHYVDQLPLWAEGRTLPWAFDHEGRHEVHRGHADAAPHDAVNDKRALSARIAAWSSTDTRVAHVFCVTSGPRWGESPLRCQACVSSPSRSVG